MDETRGLWRGKRLDNGEWAYGCLIRSSSKAMIFVLDENTGRLSGTDVDPSTLGECTGLTDKNGKPIFEGDIVTCSKEISENFVDCHIEKGYVEMKFGAFGLHRKQGYYRPFKDWLEDYEFEVIGNIHDNPELLEEKK